MQRGQMKRLKGEAIILLHSAIITLMIISIAYSMAFRFPDWKIAIIVKAVVIWLELPMLVGSVNAMDRGDP